MGRTQWKGPARFIVLAALALGWVFFAPVGVGGSTLYSSTVGISMVPLFHKGDLAILRQASTYRVGDIVLYESPVLHRPVLHRIIVIQNGRYYFKGDNNDFVDPGYATHGDLLGKLWFHIPKAGRVLGWFGAPLHTAFLAGGAAMFLLAGGGARRKTRRKRGRKRAGIRSHEPERAVRSTSTRRFLHRPRKSAENIGGAILFVAGVVALAAGFGAPLSRGVSATGYHDVGKFSYSAKTVRPSSSYPTGHVTAGEPVLLADVDNLAIGFKYRFASELPHHVHGTVSLEALIASDSSWRNLYKLEKTTRFNGDRATVGGTFSLLQLRALLDRLSVEAGTVGADYTIDLQPIVHVTGLVAGKRISSTFSPVLPFTVTQSALKLNIAQEVAPPGATYAAPSPAATLAAGLNPHQSGTIPAIAPNYLLLMRYRVAISTVRGIGLGLLGLALLSFIAKLFKPRREVWSKEKRIAHRFGCVVIDVVSFTNSQAQQQLSTNVPDFESLATMAQYCERPILRETFGPVPAYAVEDEGRLYIFRPAAVPSVSHLAPAATSEAS